MAPPTDRTQPARARLGSIELGAFRLVELLAAGSFATAYLAEQVSTGRKAVVKIAHADLFTGPRAGELRARFDAEARAAARVRHPCLVRVHAAGLTDDGVPAIAMDYVPGPALAAVLTHRRGVDLEFVHHCLTGLADTLRALHEAGVVHRDVTPRNVVWATSATGVGHPVLLDFGVAKLDNRSLGTVGAMGTPGYMPPEQLFGRAVPRSDIYALGSILWWMCTGRSFLSHFADVEDLMAFQMGESGPPDPIRENPGIPPDLADLIVWMLDPDPNARPTADQVLDVWRGILPGLRDRWTPPAALDAEQRVSTDEDAPLDLEIATHAAAGRYPVGVDVCVTIDDPLLLRLVTAYLRGEGLTVEVSTAPSATRSDGRPGPRLFVLGAEMHGVDPHELAAELRAESPGCHVILVSRVDRKSDEPTYTLPSQLDRFAAHVQELLRDPDATPSTWLPLPLNRDTIARLVETSDASRLAAEIDAFVAGFPDWFGTLDSSIGTDHTSVRTTCATISRAASSLGADRLADLAQVVHALADERGPTVRRMIGDMHVEYERVRQALALTRAQFMRA